MPDRTCPACGGLVPPKGATGPRATYCSTECRRSVAPRSISKPKPPTHYEMVCAECGVTHSGSRWALTCSDRCDQIRRDRLNPRCSEGTCNRGVRAKGLCSMHWRRLARSEGREANPEWNARRAANWQKRDALKKGAPNAEQIVYRDVFDRDGWICGLCSEHVDPATEWPDPLSPSLDHILPLSKGGPHAMANVQLAHLGCNVKKGNRIAA